MSTARPPQRDGSDGRPGGAGGEELDAAARPAQGQQGAYPDVRASDGTAPSNATRNMDGNPPSRANAGPGSGAPGGARDGSSTAPDDSSRSYPAARLAADETGTATISIRARRADPDPPRPATTARAQVASASYHEPPPRPRAEAAALDPLRTSARYTSHEPSHSRSSSLSPAGVRLTGMEGAWGGAGMSARDGMATIARRSWLSSTRASSRTGVTTTPRAHITREGMAHYFNEKTSGLAHYIVALMRDHDDSSGDDDARPQPDAGRRPDVPELERLRVLVTERGEEIRKLREQLARAQAADHDTSEDAKAALARVLTAARDRADVHERDSDSFVQTTERVIENMGRQQAANEARIRDLEAQIAAQNAAAQQRAFAASPRSEGPQKRVGRAMQVELPPRHNLFLHTDHLSSRGLHMYRWMDSLARLFDTLLRWWWAILLLLLLLLLLILLLLFLLPRGGADAPRILAGPLVIAQSPYSVDVDAALDCPGRVRYVVFPAQQLEDLGFSATGARTTRRALQQGSDNLPSPEQVAYLRDLPAGLRPALCAEVDHPRSRVVQRTSLFGPGAGVASPAGAGGSFYTSDLDLTSVTGLASGLNSPECLQRLQQLQDTTGEVDEEARARDLEVLCTRCAGLQPGVRYSVLAVALPPEGGQLSDEVFANTFVTSLGGTQTEFLGTPSVTGEGLHGFEVAIGTTTAATVFYAVTSDAGLLRYGDKTLLQFTSAPPTGPTALKLASNLTIESVGQGGIVANGQFNLTRGVVTRLTITPPCTPRMCPYTQFALNAGTNYTLHLVAQDPFGVLQNQIFSGGFRTDVDRLPPVVTDNVREVTGTSFVAGLSVSETGTLCYLTLKPDSADPNFRISATRIGELCAQLALAIKRCDFPGVLGPFDTDFYPVTETTSRRRRALALPGGGDDDGDEGSALALPPGPRGPGRALQQIFAAPDDPFELIQGQMGFIELATIGGEAATINPTGLESETLYQVAAIAADSWLPPNEMGTPFTVNIVTLDITPPRFVLGTPLARDPFKTSISLTVALNETGTAIYALYPALTPQRTVAEVRAAQGSVLNGTVAIPGGFRNVTFRLGGLQPASCYEMFWTGEDDGPRSDGVTPNRMPGPPAVLSVCTQDDAPPRFVTFRGDNFATNSFDLVIQLNTTGLVTYMVVSDAQCARVTATVDNVRLVQTAELGLARVQHGSFGVSRAFSDVAEVIRGTVERATYTIYMFAQDQVQPEPNVQTETTCFEVTLPDVTPPVLTAVLNNEAPTSFDLVAGINEPGNIWYAVYPNCTVPSSTPTASLVRQIANGTVPPGFISTDFTAFGTVARTGPAGGSATIPIAPVLPSREYRVYVAADDLRGNLAPLQTLATTTVDNQPPNITDSCVPANVALTETTATFNFELDEPGNLTYLVLPAADPAPSEIQLRAGRLTDGRLASANVSGVVAALGTPAPQPGGACSNLGPVGNEPGEFLGPFNVTIRVLGLLSGTAYRLHILSQDIGGRSGIVSLPACPVANFTTPDLTPPLFTLLQAFFSPPTAFRVDTALNEPGEVRFVIYPDGLFTELPTPAQVLELRRPDGSFATPLSGSIDVPAPLTVYSARGCGLSSAVTYSLYGIAQDRRPNVQDAVTRVPVNSTADDAGLNLAQCTQAFLTRDLRPTIRPTLGLPGRGVGNTTLVDGRFSRGIDLFRSALPGAAVEIVATTGGVSDAQLQIPTSIAAGTRANITGVIAANQAASVGVIMQTSDLFTDFATLQLRYFLRDADGRPQVATPTRVSVVVTVGAQPPAELTCIAPSLPAATTGVGTCRAAVPPSLFPTPGAAAATASAVVRATLTTGVVDSAPASVVLQPPPTHTETTTAGFTVTMPQKPMLPGEEFTAVVTAHSGGTSIKTWSVPFYFDAGVVEYTGAVSTDPLWKAAIVATGSGFVGFNTEGRADGVSRAQVTGTAVPILTATFRVRTGTTAGPKLNALSVGAVQNPAKLTGDFTQGAAINADRPIAQINDQRGGAQQAYQLVVVAEVARGLYATAARAVVVNTAVLNGADVTSAITVRSVSSRLSAADADVTALAQCTPDAATAGSVVAMTGCRVTLSNVLRNGGVSTITVAQGGLTTAATVTVLFPLRLQIAAGDTLLSRVLDPSAQDAATVYPGIITAGCTQSLYQNTTLRVYATFGGAGLPNTTDVEVTDLVSLTTSDPTVVQLASTTALGVSGPGSAVISTGASTAAALATSITISTAQEVVCLTSLDVVVFTGAAVASGAPAGGFPLDAGQTVSFTPAQRLTAERARAYVRAYVRTFDDAVHDVTGFVNFTSTRPDIIVPAGRDSNGNQIVQVTAQLGSPALCGRFIKAQMRLCGAAVIEGLAPVRVELPGIRRIRRFEVRQVAAASTTVVTRITRAGDPAGLAPMSLPTQARLFVELELDDGTFVDFSADARTRFNVTVNAGLLTLAKNAGGATIANAAGNSSAFGTATLRVDFPALNRTDLTATTTLNVVLWKTGVPVLLDYFVGPRATDQDLTRTASQPARLQKFECTATAWQSLTAWHRAVLTDDSVFEITPQSTLILSNANARWRENIVTITQAALPDLFNRLQPLAAGTVTVTMQFGTGAAQRNSTVDITLDDATLAAVTTLTVTTALCDDPTTPPLCAATLRGIAGSKTKLLDAEIIVNTANYNRYFAFTGVARGPASAYDILPTPEVLAFASSQTAWIAVDTFGDLTIVGNSAGVAAAQLTTTYTCAANPTLTDVQNMHANLDPAPGDADVGELHGPQFQRQPILDTGARDLSTTDPAPQLRVPVRINAATGALEAFQIILTFDPAVLLATSCTQGAGWRFSFQCTINKPANQVNVIGIGTDTGTTGAAVVVADVAFTLQTAGTSAVGAVVREMVLAGQPILRDFNSTASAGSLTVASRRRALAAAEPAAPAARTPSVADVAAAAHPFAVHARQRGLQTATNCTVAQQASVLGDVDGDCQFRPSDALALLKVRNFWNPLDTSRPDFRDIYFDRLAELSADQRARANVASDIVGVTARQIANTDPTFEYLSTLAAGDKYFQPRPDGTAFAGTPYRSRQAIDILRPGDDQAILLYQLVLANTQKLYRGLTKVVDTNTLQTSLRVEVRSDAGALLADAADTTVKLELRTNQNLVFKNPAAGNLASRTSDNTYLVTADFLGAGVFEARLLSLAAGNVEEQVQEEAQVPVAVHVEVSDAAGQPFATPENGFFAYYGTTAGRPAYLQASPGALGYVPYTELAFTEILTFFPAFPSAVNITSTKLTLRPGITSRVGVNHNVAFVGLLRNNSRLGGVAGTSPALIPTAAQVLAPTSIPGGCVAPACVSGTFVYSRTSGGVGNSVEVTGLTGAGVYDIFVHVEGVSRPNVLGALFGVVTPDTSAPTVTAISVTPEVPTPPADLSNSLTFSVDLTFDEPATLQVSAFKMCTHCGLVPSIAQVQNARTICTEAAPASGSGAPDCRDLCRPVFPTNSDNGATVTAVTGSTTTTAPFTASIPVSGLLSHNPIQPTDTTTCFEVSNRPPCKNFTLYVVATDGVQPSYKNLFDSCTPAAQALTAAQTAAGYVAARSCNQAVNPNANTAGNVQTGPFVHWTRGSPQPATQAGVYRTRGVGVTVSLDTTGFGPTFTDPAMPVVTSGSNQFTADFALNRQGMLAYSLFTTLSAGDLLSGGGAAARVISNGRVVVTPATVGATQTATISGCTLGGVAYTIDPNTQYLLIYTTVDPYFLSFYAVASRSVTTTSKRRLLGFDDAEAWVVWDPSAVEDVEELAEDALRRRVPMLPPA
ncbi:unnamed protein product [Pedinophyceae sp. YPF-701]|nr:unnamed protein product [Pedinophyceae sp. YPF-701]